MNIETNARETGSVTTGPYLIVTHLHPDFDAILSAWLLVRYGEERFPGIARARFHLIPAGLLPEELQNTTPGTILAVDTGGGEFDTHGTQSGFGSAALLVATRLGRAEDPALKPLLDFAEMNDGTGRSLAVGDPLAQNMLFPNLLRGLHLLPEQDPNLLFPQVFLALDQVVSYQGILREEARASLRLQEAAPFNPVLLPLLQTWWTTRGPPPPECREGSLVHWLGSEEAPRWWAPFRALASQASLTAFLTDQDKFPDSYLKSSLLGVVIGLARSGVAVEEASRVLSPLFEALLALGREWETVYAQLRQPGQVRSFSFALGKEKKKYLFNLVVVEHDSPLVLKAIRATTSRPGVILAADSKRQRISFTVSHQGPLAPLKLGYLSTLVRTAEGQRRGEKVSPTLVRGTGDKQGWFLHESEKIFSHGSLKCPAPSPSRLSLAELVNLFAVCQDETIPIAPELGCPGSHCPGHVCPFFNHGIKICRQIQTRENNPFSALFIDRYLEAARKKGMLGQWS